MISIKVLKIQDQATIIQYRDNQGMFQGRIISTKDVAGMSIGEEGIVSEDVVDTGTEWGLDFNILLGEEYAIRPSDIQQVLRRHGLWTYDDMNSNPNVVQAALNSLSFATFKLMLDAARNIT